jgi:hypothetical protein
MKFEPGQNLNYEVTQTTAMEGQAAGQAFSTTMQQTMNLIIDVLSVEADKATTDQHISRVRFDMEMPAPVNQKISYDSDATEQPDNPIAQQMSKTLGMLVGPKIKVTIDELGNYSDIQVPDEIIKGITQGPAAAMFGSQNGKETVERMFSQSNITLPEKELNVGDTWEKTTEMEMPFGTMKVMTTYTYQGPTAEGLEKIDAKVNVDLQPRENSPIAMKATSKEGGGTLLFDNKAGRLAESHIKQVLEMEVGGISKQTVTSESHLKLVPAESKSSGTSENPPTR